MKRCTIVVLLLLLLAASGRAGPARVAVVSNAAAAQTGMEDLLVANLSKEPELALVERSMLAAVMNEQAIEALASTRADRTRLGKVLAADFLLILHAKDGSLRLTVADTRLGVTLGNETLAFKGRASEQMARLLTGEALSTLRRFKDGIRAIAAVPDLISRDLLFDLNYLQGDYAEVLRRGYRSLPGVAVLAIDEAQAIAQERALWEADPKARPLFVFVEGEYRTERAGEAGRTIRLTLRARDGKATLFEQSSEAIPLANAGTFLTKVFSERLASLASTQAKAGIDVAQEFQLLTTRAQEFYSIGEYRRAVALREAALLIRPDADEQRIQLIRESIRHNWNPAEHWPAGARRSNDDPVWRGVVAETTSAWKRTLQHCEYLIRNRRLSQEFATDLTYSVLHSISTVRSTSSQLLDDCEGVRKDFILHVFALVPSLDPAKPEERRRLTGALDASNFLFEAALVRCDGNFYDKSDLDLIEDLLTNRLPERLPPSTALGRFLTHAVVAGQDPEKMYRFTRPEYVGVLTRLIASRHPVARIYGRFAMLHLRHRGQAEATAETPELLREALALQNDAKQLWPAMNGYDFFTESVDEKAKTLARVLRPKEEVARQSSVERVPPPRSALKGSTPAPTLTFELPKTARSSLPTATGRATPAPTVTFEPLEIALNSPATGQTRLTPQTVWPSGGGQGPIHRFATLGKGLDAFWSYSALLFMPQPGRADEVLASRDLTIHDVVADESHVWVSTGKGLLILDRAGRQLALVDATQGLPPINYVTQVHPLSAGKLLVSGRIRERSWIASVEFDGHQAKVNIFHEATRVADDLLNGPKTARTATTSFEPERFTEHTTAEGLRRIYLIARRTTLEIDPATLEVGLYPGSFPRVASPPRDTFASINGLFWAAGYSGDFLAYRLTADGALALERDKKYPQMGGYHDIGSLARVGDTLYCAARSWRRMDLKTEQEQELKLDKPPGVGTGDAWRLANSSHYGLVGFKDRMLYRIKVDGHDVR